MIINLSIEVLNFVSIYTVVTKRLLTINDVAKAIASNGGFTAGFASVLKQVSLECMCYDFSGLFL